MTRRRSRSGTGTHVALLRAINVGGRNRLPMARLVGMFDEVGCQRVRTYIQSGNVVFDASPALASGAGEVRAGVSGDGETVRRGQVLRAI